MQGQLPLHCTSWLDNWHAMTVHKEYFSVSVYAYIDYSHTDAANNSKMQYIQVCLDPGSVDISWLSVVTLHWNQNIHHLKSMVS